MKCHVSGVAVAFELLLQQRRVPVVEPSPTPHPVDDQVGDMDEPVVEADPIDARLSELIEVARAEGRPVGRRTVARELGVTEYRAGQLLIRTNHNGMGGTS